MFQLNLFDVETWFSNKPGVYVVHKNPLKLAHSRMEMGYIATLAFAVEEAIRSFNGILIYKTMPNALNGVVVYKDGVTATSL